jgi:nucleotide-binding universal stress UspA family protein
MDATTSATREPRRIVVGIDGSEPAEHAAFWAADLATALGVNLHLQYAIDSTGSAAQFTRLPLGEYQNAVMDEAQALLRGVHDRLSREHPDVPITVEVSLRSPVIALADASDNALLMVVGTRGRGGFADLLLGSVSLRLAAHSACPTILVPPAGRAQGDPRGEIVVGIEDRKSAETASFALDMARRLGTGVRAVHAWEPIPPYSGYYFIDPRVSQKDADDVLAAALEPARESHPDIQVTAETPCGSPAAALIGAAQGARLLVLGAHRHHGPLSLGVGPVLHPLLAHSPCPLAIVPNTA